MKPYINSVRFLSRLSFILVLVVSLNIILSAPAAAQLPPPSEYFQFSYNIGGLTPPPQVNTNQTFTVNITGQVTAIKDLPGWIGGFVTGVTVTGRITARHSSGTQIVLNSGYTVNLSPVPKTAGQTLNINQSLSLQFPAGSASGDYTVVGELVSAIAQPLGLDIKTLLALPASQTVGTVTLLASAPAGGGGGGGGGGAIPVVAPTVITETSSSVDVSTARLNGSLNSMGTATSVYVSFEWGLATGSYNAATIPPQLMSTMGPFSFALNGLSAEFTYHYRAKAAGDGTTYGVDKTFTSLSPCFIATAAFGTPTSEKINVLREFRNEVLLKSEAGKDFVSLYYKISPTIAKFIFQHNAARTVVRKGFIEPLVFVVKGSEKLWNR